MHGFRFIHLYCDINDDTKHHNMEFSAWMTKTKKNGHSILKRFQNMVIGMLCNFFLPITDKTSLVCFGWISEQSLAIVTTNSDHSNQTGGKTCILCGWKTR